MIIINKNKTPRNFVIPFNLKNALLLQEASENPGIYKSMSVKISNNNDNLEYEFIFIKRFEDNIEKTNIEEKKKKIINKNKASNDKEILDNYPKANN